MKAKLALTTFSICISIICYANKVDNYNELQNTAKLNQEPAKLIINIFEKLPKEIDGCACYFFSSEKEKKEEKYICVNDFANLAFISINGNLEKFELVKHEDNSRIFLYANKSFYLKIEITKMEAGEAESSNIEGIITVKTKDGKELAKKIIGLCGC